MTLLAVTRGDVVTIADRGGDFTGKLRLGVIVQHDLFNALDSVTVCPLTSQEVEAQVLRISIGRSDALPLRLASWIAVDKITTMRRDRLGPLIGRLSPEDIQRLNAAIVVFLGIGG